MMEQRDGRKDLERDALLAFLSDLVRIPSVKSAALPQAPFGEATVQALQLFLNRAEEDGFRVGNVDNYAGYLEFGPENAEMVAAICHLDVVPAGDWKEAFKPRIADGRIIGRGTADDKGPAVAVYFALLRLLHSGESYPRRLRLILGLDEESGSACMRRYRETEELPRYAFTADADFPVIHAEKGLLHFAFRFPRQTQGNAARLLAIQAGDRANVVPASCVLRYQTQTGDVRTIEAAGKAAHAAQPQDGVNAIQEAVRSLAGTGEDAVFQHEAFLRFLRDHAADCRGEALGVACQDAESGALTFNAAAASQDGDDWRLLCDIRYPVTLNGEKLIEKLRNIAETAGGRLECIAHSPALYFPKDHPLVAALLKVYAEISGSAAEPLAIGGGTYARSIPNTVAFGSVFPGEIVHMHETGEASDIGNLLRSVDYYEAALKALAYLS